MLIDAETLLSRPYEALDELLTSLPEPGSQDQSGDDTIRNACHEALYGTGVIERVPLLTKHNLATGALSNNQLVRYQGMVQDMYTPEFYLGSFEQVEVATGRKRTVQAKYRDVVPSKADIQDIFDNSTSLAMERLPLYCIPVPGLSAWANPALADSDNVKAVSKVQRASLSHKKRVREPETSEVADVHQPAAQQQCCDKSTRLPPSASSAPVASDTEAAFRHEQEVFLDGLPCLARIYDAKDGELKLNDVVELVGILSFDGPESSEQATPDDLNQMQRVMDEMRQDTPPPSLAPRLHVVTFKKLTAAAPTDEEWPVGEGESLCANGVAALRAMCPAVPLTDLMGSARKGLVQHLTAALGGDELAAEYALLALVAKAIHAQSNAMDMPLQGPVPGLLSVSLAGQWGEGRVDALLAALAAVVPRCARLDVTAQTLSKGFGIAPRKDYDRDRLMASALQLAAGTVLLVNETCLQPAVVGASATASNLAALQSIMQRQRLPYDFGFYKLDFPAEYPTLVLTKGGGGLVEAQVVVPVVGNMEFHAQQPGEAELHMWRTYLAAVRQMSAGLDGAVCELAEKEWVSARQVDPSITPDTFNIWLTMARLLAQCDGATNVMPQHWHRMKVLEALRRRRLEANKQGAPPTAGEGHMTAGRASPESVMQTDDI